MKYRKLILTVLVSLFVCLVFVGVYSYCSVPRLSAKAKAEVEALYFQDWCMSSEEIYARQPLIWYDENWYREEVNVWRYIGTYGDCYAFLRMSKNIGGMFEPIELPVEILGLSYAVYYPRNAYVFLYHTKREFPSDDVFYTVVPDKNNYMVKMTALYSIQNRSEWLTDEQLEQLTRDIEKIAAKYN